MIPQQFCAWREAFGGRRFLMTMGASAVNTLLLVYGKLSESAYLTTFLATIGAYLAAVGYQKHTEVKASAQTP